MQYYEIIYINKRWTNQWSSVFRLVDINQVFRQMETDWDKYFGKHLYAFGVVESNADLTKLPPPNELI